MTGEGRFRYLQKAMDSYGPLAHRDIGAHRIRLGATPNPCASESVSSLRTVTEKSGALLSFWAE